MTSAQCDPKRLDGGIAKEQSMFIDGWERDILTWCHMQGCQWQDHHLAFFIQPHFTSLPFVSIFPSLSFCFYVNWPISKLLNFVSHHRWGKNQRVFSVMCGGWQQQGNSTPHHITHFSLQWVLLHDCWGPWFSDTLGQNMWAHVGY